MERTKLVGTMGPVSESKEVLRQVIEAGLNVVRMNFSHGDHEEHLERVKQRIRNKCCYYVRYKRTRNAYKRI